jgi:hypothetical protein
MSVETVFFWFCNNVQCSFHSQYFPIDQTAIFILIAIYNLFFKKTHIFGNFSQTRNYSIYCDAVIFDHKIEPCRFPHLWLRRNNGTFTVLRCTVGIRCFTVSVYFLLQINFFKSTFDFYLFDLFGLSLFYENFESNFSKS